MSATQIEKFVAIVAARPQMIEEAGKGAADPRSFIRQVTAYAKTQGFDFTEQEAIAWVKAQAAQAEDELSDTQLEAVAGGKKTFTNLAPVNGIKVKGLKHLASVL